MKFRIDLKIFLFALVFYFTKQIEIYSLVMFFAIIHEFGHLMVGLLLGMKPSKFELTPYGIGISFEITPKDYNYKIGKGNWLEVKKILVALAGPMTNFVIILICFKLDIGFFSGLRVIYTNILLIVFNLLPIYPLDGGRIIKGILHIKFGKQKADKYINNLTLIVLILLTFISSIAIYQLQNISIFIINIFLWCLYIKEDRIYQKRKNIYELLKEKY